MNTRQTEKRQSLKMKIKPMDQKAKRLIHEYEEKEKEREKQEVKMNRSRYEYENK